MQGVLTYLWFDCNRNIVLFRVTIKSNKITKKMKEIYYLEFTEHINDK